MKFIFLIFMLSCQPTCSCQSTTPILDAGPAPDAEIIWEVGCTNYECTISREQIPKGLVIVSIKWCCPYLDKAIGNILMADSSGKNWISTVSEHQCGSTAVFFVSPLITSIDVSMQTKSRPEIADKCVVK